MLKKCCGLNGRQHLEDLGMDTIFGLAWELKASEGMKDKDVLICCKATQRKLKDSSYVILEKGKRSIFVFGTMSRWTQLPPEMLTCRLSTVSPHSEQLLPEDPNCKEEVCQATDAKGTQQRLSAKATQQLKGCQLALGTRQHLQLEEHGQGSSSHV